MIKPLLYANVAGVNYILNSDHIHLLDYDLNISNVERISQTLANMDGDIDLGFNMSPRYLAMTWAISGNTTEHYRQLRQTMLQCFRPRQDDPIQFVFNFNGEVRALDCFLDGALNWFDRVDKVEKVTGIFKASDPRLYDPTINTHVFSTSESEVSGLGWEIPWEIPWEVGLGDLSVTATIDYANNSGLAAPEFPLITVYGPIKSPKITNETTGEVLDFSNNGGLELAENEYITIRLLVLPSRDSKTIFNNIGQSVSQYLTPQSDLATWHLSFFGEKLDNGGYSFGSNTIAVEGSDITNQTRVVMSWHNRYIAY